MLGAKPLLEMMSMSATVCAISSLALEPLRERRTTQDMSPRNGERWSTKAIQEWTRACLWSTRHHCDDILDVVEI